MHRIGQTNPVKVIRLVAAQTVEELILKRAFLKLRLTHAVIDEGGFSLVSVRRKGGREEGEDGGRQKRSKC